LEPAASATGVREELLLIGKPWKKPAARLAAPRPIISWFGSTRGIGARGIGSRQYAGVGEGDDRDRHAADQDGDDISRTDPWDGESRKALGHRPKHLHPGRLAEPEHPGHDRRQDDGDQNSRETGESLGQQDQGQRSQPQAGRHPVGLAVEECLGNGDEVSKRTAAFDGKAEQLGQLADQHCERDTVHIAVADRLREQLGDEAQPKQAGQDANRA
jgi:hypothetical protein